MSTTITIHTPHSQKRHPRASPTSDYSDEGSDSSDYSDDENSPTPGRSGMGSPDQSTPPPRSHDARRGKGKKKDREFETDSHRLQQRMKQIAYGENTQGFKNLCKILEMDPTLLKGCLPVKPSVFQKCSKRSWDGQIRKWRRALHMYDFVDFGESEEQSQAVKQKLIEQTKNPIFTPLKADGPEIVSPKAKPVPPRTPEASTAPPVNASPMADLNTSTGTQPERVRYTIEQLLEMEKAPRVQSATIKLPEALHWLDKRFDLEEEFDDDLLGGHLPATPLRTPAFGFPSPSPLNHHAVPYSPGTPFHNTTNTTPTRSTPLCSSITPFRTTPAPCRAVPFPERTPGKTNLFA